MRRLCKELLESAIRLEEENFWKREKLEHEAVRGQSVEEAEKSILGPELNLLRPSPFLVGPNVEAGSDFDEDILREVPRVPL